MVFQGQNIPREELLAKVQHLLLTSLEKFAVTVYLFGSWARNEERRTSDIDLAIWYEKPLPPGTLAKLRHLFDESDIPYRVDIVDLTKADQALVDNVKKEGILWKDCRSE